MTVSELITGYGLISITLAQEPASQAAAESGMHRSLVEYINSAGTVGYLLLLLSVIAVALWILLGIELRMERMAPRQAVDAIGRFFRDGNTADALRYCQSKENDCFLTRLFAGAILRCSRSQFGFLEMRSALEDSGQREVERLYRTCDWVALIAAVGPMLGLLGTVFGMIGAFGAISNLQGAARSQQLADYMSLALVATAMGLAVAIPCTAMYAIYRRRVDTLADRVATIAEGLVIELEPQRQADARAGSQATRPTVRPVPQKPAFPPAAAADSAR